MAMALVLLAGAGLMIRSLGQALERQSGLQSAPRDHFRRFLSHDPGCDPDAIRASMRQLQDTVAAVPGVEAASLNAGALPMSGDSELPFWIDGQPKPATIRK
jgi:hypothetical protein